MFINFVPFSFVHLFDSFSSQTFIFLFTDFCASFPDV